MLITPYHAKYFAYELSKRCVSADVEKLASTLVDAQVDLNPHQVTAALFAFDSPFSKGAILADEVGLGKTIEAGLVISQYWAERKRKILIITPANLRKQWSQELLEKFHIPSIILEAKSFNALIKSEVLNPFEQSEIILCSYQFARNKKEYLKDTAWDIVVIDEAHRLRNVYKKQNKTAQDLRSVLQDVPKILLTATPFQNSLMELYGLVSIIDDKIFGDIKSFRARYCSQKKRSEKNSGLNDEILNELKERIQPICNRTLRRQVLEYINYTNRISLVQEYEPTFDEQQLYDSVTSYLRSEVESYAIPKRLKPLMTLILRRLLASSTYAIAGTLFRIAERLEHMLNTNESISVPRSQKERHDYLKDLFLEQIDNAVSFDELGDEYEAEPNEKANADQIELIQQNEGIRSEAFFLRELAEFAESIQENAKGENLIIALKRGFSELNRLGAPQKAIIFTDSRRTQQYIKTLLENEGYAGKIVLFNGTNTDTCSQEIYQNWIKRYKNTDKVTGSRSADMRAALVDQFREEATFMIATEAAAEGINLQFCSLVINYDLPWNPQRIEQRIGRCHRYGQKFDVVVINFLNKRNEADQMVYKLLESKFKLFNGVFGASDEVLGSLEDGIDFERRISRIYQECRTTEQIANAFNELQAELEGSISDAMKNTRQQLLENFDEEVTKKLKINLEETQECLSQYENWLWLITQYLLDTHATFASERKAFELKTNPFPKLNIPLGTYKIGKHIEDAHLYRLGHPLAIQCVQTANALKLGMSDILFNYTDSERKIGMIEPLIGKHGWLIAVQLSITSLEIEDHILFAVSNEQGEILDAELGSHLFSLSGTLASTTDEISSQDQSLLTNDIAQQTKTLLEKTSERNNVFFDQEMTKLDRWGDDRRFSITAYVDELNNQIHVLRKQIQTVKNLPEKLRLEKSRRKLESERNYAWRKLETTTHEIEHAKDSLIENAETKMSLAYEQHEIFSIRWQVI